MNNDVRLTLRLPADLKEDLKELAEAEGRTTGDYVRQVLEAHALAVLGPRE